MKIFLTAIFFLSYVFTFAYQAKPYNFPVPVDTKSNEVRVVERKTLTIDNSVFFNNTFASAHLDSLSILNNSYRVFIFPENEPINYSPWYAFKVWAIKDTTISIIVDYGNFKHRYYPKISSDGTTWTKLPKDKFKYLGDSSQVRINLDISKDIKWVAAQEIQNSKMVEEWSKNKGKAENSFYKVAGKSKLGRDIPVVEFSTNKENPIVVVFSRQHPPEVTGYLAMKSFMERILKKDELSGAFLKHYTVLMFPLLNPDGVDLGHWRHNAGGVDLNRDWAYYNQPETRQVANYVVNFVKENDAKVVLGLDFHSTYKDIYYTNVDSLVSTLPGFSKEWISQIKDRIEDNEAKISSSGLGKPVSKAWFYTQFGAEGITYEIGDTTNREMIEVKGAVSAEEMMKILLKNTK